METILERLINSLVGKGYNESELLDIYYDSGILELKYLDVAN